MQHHVVRMLNQDQIVWTLVTLVAIQMVDIETVLGHRAQPFLGAVRMSIKSNLLKHRVGPFYLLALVVSRRLMRRFSK